MTITIDTLNAIPNGAHTYRRLDDGTVEVVDNSNSQPVVHQVDMSKPIKMMSAERWAQLPLRGGKVTHLYPAWALTVAVALGMNIEAEHGTFTVAEVPSDE